MASIWNRLTKLFGVNHHDETDSCSIKHQCAWDERRRRLLNRRCGDLTKGPDYSPVSSSRVKREIGRHSHRRQNVPVKPVGMIAEFQHEQPDINDENYDNKEPIPLTATSATSITHAPISRTFSDTAINKIATKPRYPKDDNLSLGSHDSTDFYSKESVKKLLNDILTRHQPRRAFGMGLVGNLLSRKFRKDLTRTQLNAIYSFNDHRPYFTYWVTTVQILIMIITLINYGFGPIGFTKTIVTHRVRVSSSDIQQGSYYEDESFWLGPRPRDLIHLGAKFTPCMRKDSQIYHDIHQDRELEKSTGCCIRNDQSGCIQTLKGDCSSNSKWHSWNESTSDLVFIAGQKRRTSGPVCGQDPKSCLRPASIYPHEWPDDITKWPICHEQPEVAKALHPASCEVVGRPCCIGIYGQCRITTSEHCQFLRGTFHPEARLCSQVSCMEDVCGMIPFYAKDYPDQFYRLFTALFLHAGIIHLAFTVILQHHIMRDIERLLGSTRMAIIYIVPGVAGYLSSAAFVPYHTQVGPSGSQFALLACLIAETINGWKLLEDPLISLGKLLSIAGALLILGLLPWIDNYAHIFGFIVGLWLSLALTPYLTPFNDVYSRRKKVIQIWICIALVVVSFILLTLPLYVFPVHKCSWCQYLDCIPLTPYWCENHDIKLTRWDAF